MSKKKANTSARFVGPGATDAEAKTASKEAKHEGPHPLTHLESPADLASCQHLMGIGVPWRTIRDALAAGFSWKEIISLLLKFGLPLLEEWLNNLKAGTTTKDEILKKANETKEP